ncbi:MAG: Mov34/MPN/PAD-1 family protein [Bryobacteraceae bacterium]
MVTRDSGSETCCWKVAGQPVAVEYSRTLLDTLRAEVVDGFHKLQRGGLEVGGVLFGKRSGGTVRILAWRPLASEHAAGPGFVLSEKDDEALRRLVDSAAADPELAGLEAVGWYHSHTRSGLILSAEDVGIWDRHFPEAWQIALVLHPEKLKPTRAGFFCRGEDGVARPGPSPLEFDVEAIPKPRKAPRPAPVAAPREPTAEPPPAIAARRPPGRLSWFFFALAWCVAAISLAYALRDYWLPKPPAQEPPPVIPAAAPADPDKERMMREIEALRAELDRANKRASELEARLAGPARPTKKRK